METTEVRDRNGIAQALAHDGGMTNAGTNTAPSAPVAPVKPYKFKYSEAGPAPEGVENEEWDKIFAAADSRLYTRFGKKAKKSAGARQAGETYQLSLQILAERRERAAKVRNSLQIAQTPTPVVPTASTPAPTASTPAPTSSTSAPTVSAPASTSSSPAPISSRPAPILDVSNSSTHTRDKINSEPTLGIEKLDSTSAVTMDSASERVPTDKGNKGMRIEGHSSRNATPDAAAKTGSASANIKGKGRASNQGLLTEGTSSEPAPAAASSWFGRQDPKDPVPFSFGGETVPNFDDEYAVKGKDSQPALPEEFHELQGKLQKMNVAHDEYQREADVDVNAHSTNDFDPDPDAYGYKTESGPRKRWASFEPLAKPSPRSPAGSPANTASNPFELTSPRSPVSSRSNSPKTRKEDLYRSDSPEPLEANKAPKKKANRGQKKKVALAKKKAAAKAEKEIGESAKQSAEADEDGDEEEEGETDGASSDDGGVYCICRGPDDHRLMIACDICNEWYHCSCVGIKDSDEALIDKYVCTKCHVPNIHQTTFKPLCRLDGCKVPARVHGLPKPSKYCSHEHKMEWGRQMVARARDDDEPSKGGAISKGELKTLLEHTRGRPGAFHRLGQRPTLPASAQPVDWTKILTDEEKARMCQTTAEKIELQQRSNSFKDKEKFIRMAVAKLNKATKEKPDLAGACGWDERLALNEVEFALWRNSASGIQAFESGVLDGEFCERKRCVRHGGWIKVNLHECRVEDLLVVKRINKLRDDEHSIKRQAGARAAAQL